MPEFWHRRDGATYKEDPLAFAAAEDPPFPRQEAVTPYRFARAVPVCYRDKTRRNATECDDLRKSCFSLSCAHIRASAPIGKGLGSGSHPRGHRFESCIAHFPKPRRARHLPDLIASRSCERWGRSPEADDCEYSHILVGEDIHLSAYRPIELHLFAPSRRIHYTDVFHPDLFDAALESKTTTSLLFHKDFIKPLIDLGYEGRDGTAR